MSIKAQHALRYSNVTSVMTANITVRIVFRVNENGSVIFFRKRN